jgi:hypothetical protein
VNVVADLAARSVAALASAARLPSHRLIGGS